MIAKASIAIRARGLPPWRNPGEAPGKAALGALTDRSMPRFSP